MTTERQCKGATRTSYTRERKKGKKSNLLVALANAKGPQKYAVQGKAGQLHLKNIKGTLFMQGWVA